MTTWTTEDREALEKGLDFFNKLKGEDTAEPIPFAGWVDKEDTETMLREQLQILQAECQRLKKILINNGIPS